jgi:hypothetical protein
LKKEQIKKRIKNKQLKEWEPKLNEIINEIKYRK